MVCIYHSRDLDGWCSGAIVKKAYPGTTMIGYDYGKKFPWEIFREGEPVIMVDVSLPMDDMEKLNKKCGGKLTWIDHHISAINEYKASGYSFAGVLEVGIAACQLTWEYFFPFSPVPKAVDWLGYYDVFRQDEDWERFVLPFQMGMRLMCNSPENFPEVFLNENREVMSEQFSQGIDELYEKVLSTGHTVLKYQKQTWKTMMKSSFEISFAGYNAICINTKGLSSLAFEGYYNRDKHQLMIAFSTSGNGWNFSIYTTHFHIDCSEIAKQYGGGGHRKAAGFSVKSLYGLEGFEQLV